MELRSDSASPPTTVRCQVRNAMNALALVGGVLDEADFILTYLVPPAHWVRLVATGTGTSTLVRQTEVLL